MYALLTTKACYLVTRKFYFATLGILKWFAFTGASQSKAYSLAKENFIYLQPFHDITKKILE